MKYDEIVLRASEGNLTADNINEIVLAIADKNLQKDASLKDIQMKLSRHDRGLRDIEEEYPLLPPEADDLSKAVRNKGVEMLGGKKSPAYANKELRQRVFRDIYTEIKREYGLINEKGGQESYKKLKRKYISGALKVVEDYVLPMALEDEITAVNDLEGME